MGKNIKKAGLILLAIIILATVFISGSKTEDNNTSNISPTLDSSEAPTPDLISYQGESGKDALILLEENAEVEKSASGLVVAINGRKAEDSKKEFWAFYVNGEMAQVGPADYQTKNEDEIEWKIENY